MIDEREVLTVTEAAKVLRIAPRTYYQAAARGEVPATRVGRRIIVSGAALRRLLDEPTDVYPLERDEVADNLVQSLEGR